MSAWIFVWLMLVLKIPIVALYLIVRWAVRQTPEPVQGDDDGGVGPRGQPRHPRGRPPRAPRRGPHGGLRPAAPLRSRTVLTRRPAFSARQLPSIASR